MPTGVDYSRRPLAQRRQTAETTTVFDIVEEWVSIHFPQAIRRLIADADVWMVGDMSPRTAVAADVGRRGPAQDGASSSFHLLTAGEAMSGPPEVIDADESMWQAARRLGDGSHRRLVVLDEGRLAGVIDEKTLTDHWPRIPFFAQERTLRTLVPGRVHAVMPHVTISRVAAIMHFEGADAVPVVDRRGKVLGLVTATEIIRLLARGDASAQSPSPAPGGDELDVRRAQ
jgi:CBS domain-containing protein